MANIDDAASPSVSGSATSNNAAIALSPTASTVSQDPSIENNNSSVLARPNPLHNYVNWTYQIAFYMTPPQTYTGSATQGGWSSNGSVKLFQSGGFEKTNTGVFKRDYIIDSLRFTSVVGINDTSRNTSIYDIEMVIVEPYSIKFLAEITEQAALLGIDDHLNTPYLIEIKYHGYDDSGNIVSSIPECSTKYFPVKIINVAFKVGPNGTRYTISMAPYATEPLSRALDQGVLPINVTVKGKVVGDLMNSLSTALNGYEETKLNQQTVQMANLFQFIVKDAPGSESLNNSPVKFELKGGATATRIEKRDFYINDANEQVFELRAGSLIKEVIMRLVQAAQYFPNQTSITGKPNNAKPAELLKIIPTIQLGPWDHKTRTYQKSFTYLIIPYRMYGQQSDGANSGGVDLRGPVKEYNWVFTGKNDDILNVDVEYNFQYFVRRSTGTLDKSRAILLTDTPQDSRDIAADPTNRVTAGANVFGSTVAVTERQADTIAPIRGNKSAASDEFFDSQLNSNTIGDMVNLRMEIIGDPDWLPQDRSVLPKGTDINWSKTGYVDDNQMNGISTDTDAIHVKLQFKTPRDYNDTTGLVDLQGQDFITGIYQIVTVESRFEQGKFTQVLFGVRVENQKSNNAVLAGNANDESSGGLILDHYDANNESLGLATTPVTILPNTTQQILTDNPAGQTTPQTPFG